MVGVGNGKPEFERNMKLKWIEGEARESEDGEEEEVKKGNDI